MLLPAPGWTQEASAPKSNLVAQGGGLKIVVLKGEGAVNSIKGKSATPPAVEVRDDQDKPIAGAEVVFALPAAGPGAVFNGWMRTQTARTDEQGQASASGMVPNDEAGRFNIKVTATSGTKSASLVIAQSNAAGTAQAKSSRKLMWTIIGLAAVGGIAGGIAGTRGDGATTPAAVPVPITATVGPITVAGPR